MSDNKKEKLCGFCEYYEPFVSDIFNEPTNWGKCQFDCWGKDGEWIQGKIPGETDEDAEACEHFTKSDRKKLPSY